MSDMTEGTLAPDDLGIGKDVSMEEEPQQDMEYCNVHPCPIDSNACDTTAAQTQVWTAPDGSFTKKTLEAGEGLESPHDGWSCEIVVETLSECPLTEEDAGCPIEKRCQFRIGESETAVAEALGLCLTTMHRGEVCELTVMAEPSGSKLPAAVRLLLTLLDFIREDLCHLRDPREKYDWALHHKNRGNELFQKGNIPYAFKRFTRSLKYVSLISPQEASQCGLGECCQKLKSQLYSNMAACQLKEGDLNFVIANCSQALNFDPVNVKALFRRAEAQCRLRQFDGAKVDLELALRKEPKNSAVLQKLQEVNDALEVSKKELAGVLSKMFSP